MSKLSARNYFWAISPVVLDDRRQVGGECARVRELLLPDPGEEAEQIQAAQAVEIHRGNCLAFLRLPCSSFAFLIISEKDRLGRGGRHSNSVAAEVAASSRATASTDQQGAGSSASNPLKDLVAEGVTPTPAQQLQKFLGQAASTDQQGAGPSASSPLLSTASGLVLDSTTTAATAGSFTSAIAYGLTAAPEGVEKATRAGLGNRKGKKPTKTMRERLEGQPVHPILMEFRVVLSPSFCSCSFSAACVSLV